MTPSSVSYTLGAYESHMTGNGISSAEVDPPGDNVQCMISFDRNYTLPRIHADGCFCGISQSCLFVDVTEVLMTALRHQKTGK